MSLLDKTCIWIPNGEYYGGVTDRHVVLSSPKQVEVYLNILETFVTDSDTYLKHIKDTNVNNLESCIKQHLVYHNGLDNNVMLFPYVMYSVRPNGGSTRWSSGDWSEKYQCFIKYSSEYDISSKYKDEYMTFDPDIKRFYIDKLLQITLATRT